MVRCPFDFWPTQTSSLGARLSAFMEVWVENCTDQWVVSTIQQSHFWKFRHCQPQMSFLSTRDPRSPEKDKILQQYVQSLIQQQVVVPVPESVLFRLLFFSVPSTQKVGKLLTSVGSKKAKQVNSSRTLQNGIAQYSHTNRPTWRLDGLHRLPKCLFATRLPILSKVQSGQSSPPIPVSTLWHLDPTRTFTKVLVAILAFLCDGGFEYCITWMTFLSFPKTGKLMIHQQEVMNTLIRFGWVINHANIQFIPTQKMLHLGALFDTQEQSVLLPPEKVPVIREKASKALMSKRMLASDCYSLLGSFSVCIPMIKWSRWHLRVFQHGFLSQWRKKTLTQDIIITLDMKSSL